MSAPQTAGCESADGMAIPGLRRDRRARVILGTLVVWLCQTIGDARGFFRDLGDGLHRLRQLRGLGDGFVEQFRLLIGGEVAHVGGETEF